MNELFEVEPNSPQTPLIKIWSGQPRPSYDHPLVLEGIVAGILLDIIKWCEADNDVDKNEIKKDLEKIFKYAHSLDGYDLARQLDSWSPDAELVEILDNSQSIRNRIISKFTKTWIEQNQEIIKDLLAKFPVSTKVSYKLKWSGTKTGEIKTIFPGFAQASIIENGRTKSGNPVINLEDLKLLNNE